MRLLILFILFVCSSSVNGQIITASSPYRVRSGCATKLLDAYSGASAAYSLRKLDADYAGSAIRVRRSSDNTEQDIGFVGCGDLDTASMKTFVGTGGTDDGFVVTWYDQSGNSRDAGQSTAGNQPLIMDNGVVLRKGNNPAVLFDGSNDRMFDDFNVTSNAAWLFALTSKEADGGAGNASSRIASLSAGAADDYSSTNYLIFAYFNRGSAIIQSYRNNASGPSAGTYTNANRYLVYSYINATELGIAKNGASVTTGSTSGTALNSTQFTIGASSNTPVADSYLNGYVQEVVLYLSDASSNKSGIESNINTYWGVY